MNKDEENKEAIDFSNAMEDFDASAQSQDKERLAAKTFPPETPKMVQWVIKYSGGLVKMKTKRMVS